MKPSQEISEKTRKHLAENGVKVDENDTETIVLAAAVQIQHILDYLDAEWTKKQDLGSVIGPGTAAVSTRVKDRAMPIYAIGQCVIFNAKEEGRFQGIVLGSKYDYGTAEWIYNIDRKEGTLSRWHTESAIEGSMS